MKKKFNLDSSVYNILKEEKSRQVIFKYIPEIIETRKFKIYKFIKIKDLLKKLDSYISEDIIRKIEIDLEGI